MFLTQATGVGQRPYQEDRSKPSPVFCKNCGSQIFQDQFDNGGPKWVHGHSSLFVCGTADGIQTIAEPAQ